MWRPCRNSTSCTRYIKNWPAKKRQDFIWDKIVYANPVKDNRTLAELDPYKPLVTYDNLAEVGKIKKYAPHAGLVLRVNVPNTGSMVELSSKFGASPGEAVDLMEAAFNAGLWPSRGFLFTWAASARTTRTTCRPSSIADGIFKEAWERGHKQVKILDIGGGFPAPYDPHVTPVRRAGQDVEHGIRPAFWP
jgi:ornithine decarboxylase